MHLLKNAFKKSFPLAITVIPFGMVKGSLAASGDLGLIETMGMSLFIFAGAAQLAMLQLMMENIHFVMIIISAAMINFRMILYSVYFSDRFKKLPWYKKLIYSHMITDQSYAIYQSSAKTYEERDDKLRFYFFSAFIFFLFWQTSVFAGFYFGNAFANISDMDFMVPLVFIGMLGPHLKQRFGTLLAAISAVASIIFYHLPLNIGFILAIFLTIYLAVMVQSKNNGRISCHGKA
ncbi:AzlC family ABC transporter permease [Bacteriovoracaceae bacterium]|nr:AzlC family ABC transporter permease [Bacteriovoracaceae bacterium]